MAVIPFTTKERDLLARLMRAEAVGEGDLGMLMVGNVVVNRGIAGCLVFKDNRSISDVVYQSPGGFSGVDSPLFFSNPTTAERNLADRVIKGEYYHPATHALWFYAPKSGAVCSSEWWGYKLAGRYKSHCFYLPEPGICKTIR